MTATLLDGQHGRANEEKMLRFLFLRLMRKAGKKGKALRCPECGAKMEFQAPEQLKEPWRATQHCASCGWAGSLSAMMDRDPTKRKGRVPEQSGVDGETAKGMMAEEGAGFSVKASGDGTAEYVIPASGRGGGLLGFSIIWNVFFGVIVVLMITKGADWVAYAGISVFVLTGAFLLYAGLRHKYGKSRIILTPDEVILERTLFSSVKRKGLRRDGVTSVELKEFYSKNYEPVHGIEVRGREGKLRFGSAMEEDDKHLLCASLKRRLLPAESAASVSEESASPARKEQCIAGEAKPLTIEEEPGRVRIRSGRAGSTGCLTVFALIFLTMLVVVPVNWLRGPQPPGPFLWVAFKLLPVLAMASSLLFFLTIMWLLISFLRTTTSVEADASGLQYERKRPGANLSLRLPRHEILQVNAARPGSINRQPMWCGEIVTREEVFAFGHNATRESVEQAIAALKRVLGFQRNEDPSAGRISETARDR